MCCIVKKLFDHIFFCVKSLASKEMGLETLVNLFFFLKASVWYRLSTNFQCLVCRIVGSSTTQQHTKNKFTSLTLSHTHKHTHTHTGTHTHTNTRTHTHTHHAHTHTHTRTHTQTHTQTHTHTHTHTHHTIPNIRQSWKCRTIKTVAHTHKKNHKKRNLKKSIKQHVCGNKKR